MFDDLYERRRKRNISPDNAGFLQMLLSLLGEAANKNYSISEEDLTRQLQIILQDEFTGNVHINSNNTLTLCFTNGERFNITVEKCGLSNYHY